MKNLKTVEDFVLNAEFRDWILNPSPSANIFWESWLEEHPGKKDNFNEAAKIVQLMSRVDYQPDSKFTEAIWNKIETKIDSAEDTERKTVPLNVQSVTKKSKKRSNSGRLGFWLSFAASILLLLTSAYFLSSQIFSDDPAQEAITSIYKSNPKGQKSTIMLPDGSTAILNSESSLSYTNAYNEVKRRVVLRGEAFFKVAEDKNRPFIVQTNNLITIALGTSFNVNAFSNDLERITLVEGKVKIQSRSRNGELQEDILTPGDMVVFNTDKKLKKTEAVSFDHLGWKEGIIVFQDLSLKEAIKELEKWYGVEFELRNFPSDYNMRFTGSFDNDNLRNVLLSLSYTMSFDFDIKDKKKVVLNFK